VRRYSIYSVSNPGYRPMPSSDADAGPSSGVRTHDILAIEPASMGGRFAGSGC
jgi:hypothetical protein